ncbi:hypothetical protein N182_34915 [Sinorhizobium sp. GL2]|nr:hypothetical protein N182_34915 [Sinorhizobium sp. GL2]
MTIEQHIEELRAAIRNACNTAERFELEYELQLARANLAEIAAEQERCAKAVPLVDGAFPLPLP